MQTELLNKLVDAVTASGKKLKEIDKSAIFAFLDRSHKSAVVDYTDNSHNDVKVRQPRKTVFSEIKKIAG